MKDRFARVFALLIGMAAVSHSAADAEVIRISTGEWAPLIDSSKPNDGPLAMVVREAFALQGVAVEYVYAPWKRALHDLETGEVDASAAWRMTEARASRFLFSGEAVYQGENVFFYAKAAPFDWQTLEDLAQYRIGGVRGYAYSAEFESAAKAGKLSVFRVNDEKSLVTMLLAGRIDVFPADRQVGRAMLDALPLQQAEQITFHPKPLTRKPLYLLVRKDEKGRALIERFDRGLRTLIESGRLKQIYEEN
ncbi:MAG: amino acid ABC transporter substrate-binding protein [Gammaproteobacteria bacterium]|nr:MAG: amino acid ABC transporter substrate-binding protein [Gammaproteobacteria bacterium]